MPGRGRRHRQTEPGSKPGEIGPEDRGPGSLELHKSPVCVCVVGGVVGQSQTGRKGLAPSHFKLHPLQATAAVSEVVICCPHPASG